MNIRKIAQVIFATIAILLGTFWFLQGVGILNVCPILCFTDCACIEGGSQLWSVVGAVVFIIGILTMAVTLKDK
jgi:uncharacterized membrane protein YiaA